MHTYTYSEFDYFLVSSECKGPVICHLFFPGALSLVIWILREKGINQWLKFLQVWDWGSMKVYRMGNVCSLLDAVGENMLSAYVKGLVCV